LTAGTTWHAAGLMVTFGSLSSTSTAWRKYSKSLYQSLEAETGQSTGFLGCGFVELATERDRLEEYRRVAAFNRKEGVDVQEISAKDVEELFPLCRTDDVLAGFYVQDDGRVNPVDATQALAKGFRLLGGTIIEGVDCQDVLTEDNAVVGLKTSAGTIKTDYVVNCGGLWARELGRSHGVLIPNQGAEHYYLLTDAMPQVDPQWPVVEDPRNYAYIRPEGGGLMVGLFEGEAAAFDAQIPPFGEIPPDWDRLTPYLGKAMSRVPSVQDVGVKKLFCGPESFTPDLAPLIGEAPELSRYFVAAGLNSIGILTGPGVGRSVANWIVDGYPDVDVCGFHVDRSRDFQATEAYRLDRVKEALGDVYKCHYPSRPAWKSTSLSRRERRVDGVGRPIFDFYTGTRRRRRAAAPCSRRYTPRWWNDRRRFARSPASRPRTTLMGKMGP
jgi:glycine/D-amino acid oxidase-like deaminating enzyme